MTEGHRASDELLAFAGVQAYRAGRFHDALGMLRSALEHNPRNPTAWLYAGMMHREFGNLNESIGCISESIRLDPASAMAHAERADTHARKNDFAAARADAIKAIWLDPDYADAYAVLGNCHYMEHRYGRALVAMAKYCELSPEDEEGRRNYAEYHRLYAKAAARRAVAFLPIFLPEELGNGEAVSQLILLQVIYRPRTGAGGA